jgi:hypothetical protein
VNSASAIPTSGTPPSFKLASSISLLPRRCSRPQLWTRHLLTRPSSVCLLSTSSFANKQSSTARARELTTPRSRFSYRPLRASSSHLEVRRQTRSCSSEASSSFFAMASDRDILPAWYVPYARDQECINCVASKLLHAFDILQVRYMKGKADKMQQDQALALHCLHPRPRVWRKFQLPRNRHHHHKHQQG